MRIRTMVAVLPLIMVTGWSPVTRADNDLDSLSAALRPSRLTTPTDYRQSYSHFVSPRTFGSSGVRLAGKNGTAAEWATHHARLFGPSRIELSRLDYALHGVGAGVSTAMFIGAMANSAGLWDERTSWYIVGAAAGLGAVLGGTVAVPEDQGARVRFQWEP